MSQQKTSLSAAISSTGATSISVTDYLGFPVVAFSILIDSEVLRVTAGFGTSTWTVSRGHLGTTAATHLISATVTLVPDALADLDDLVATMALDSTVTNRYALLMDLLADVSSDLCSETMRNFFVPTADVTVYVDVLCWSSSLREASVTARTTDGRALDFVSITTLSVRDDETSSYVTIAAGDTGYYLEPGPAGAGVAGTDWPFEDITLSPAGASYNVWPIGKRAVKIVGKLGFPAYHPVVKRGVIDEARERFRQNIGGGPIQAGVNQFGTPIFVTGNSPTMRRLLRAPFSLRSYIG